VVNRETRIGKDLPDGADAPEHPPHLTDDAQPRRVLVVEDHRDCRETLCRLLTLAGFQVEQAGNGPEGLCKGLD
jgi:hypothetical protein